MTREALAITPSYPINGAGPYQYNNPYTLGALQAFVELDDRLIPLEPGEYVADPLSSNTSGSIALTTPAATAYYGGTLYILRHTDIEQGFSGQSARENGLAAQLDWMTEAIQDTAREVRRSLRSTAPITPFPIKAGRILTANLNGDGFNFGPTIEDLSQPTTRPLTAKTIASMAALTTAVDGQQITVESGENSQSEDFFLRLTGPDAEKDADGALIVTATGMGGGRWISQRTVYAGFAEFDADARSLNSGTVLAIGPYRVECVSTGEHYETTGGQKVRVLPGSDGRYPASAFGETWARLLLAINFELPLTVTAEYEASAATVTDKYVDLTMAKTAKFNFPAADANDLTFDGCRGAIRDYRANHAGDLGGGSFIGLHLYRCENFQVHGYEITGSKDVPIRIFDCDYVWAAWGKSTGGATRNYAGVVACSRDSGFFFCKGFAVGFGFLILGAGYKSGGYIPPRTYLDEQGMFIRDCYVYDHTGHAFDINGAVAGIISRCVSEKYTGTVGNSSFQIKNSDNIAGEIPDGTRASVIEFCTSIDGFIGFGGQKALGSIYRGNTAIASKTYGMYLNDCDEAVVDGITVEDWGSNPSGSLPLNSESKFAAVAVSQTSDDVTIRNVQIKQRDVTNAANMRQVYLGGDRASLSGLKVHRLTGEPNVSEGLVIDGANCNVANDVVPRYATSPLVDDAQSTQYAMQYGKSIVITGPASHIFDLSPARGMTVGSVTAYVVSGIVGDHVYQVGRLGDNNSIVTSRAVATENIQPDASFLDPGIPIQAFANGSTGTVTLNLVVAGVPVI